MKQNKIPRNEYIIKPKGKIDPYKDDVVYTNLGQWKYPGQVTKIPSNQITMQGVDYPVQGIDDTGYSQMMYPGMDYTFPGQYVTEYPQMQTAQYGKQAGDTLSPEGWEIQIRNIEHQIGNPNQWTLDSYKLLQDKLNEYKAWRENTPAGKAVVDYHNEPNEYVVPLPEHLKDSNMNYEKDLISKVLMNRNRDKDFVKRAYDVGAYPDSNMFTRPDDNRFGERNSHLMAWGVDDSGQAYMYPTVMNPTNESIKVPNQYADYISSEGYKKATGMIREKPFGGIHTKTDTHMATGGWLDSYDEGGIAEELPIEKTVIDPLVGTPTTKPLSKKQEYQNAIKNNYSNYIESVHNRTPFDKLTSEGHMNCIHGVCTVIEGTKAKKFNQNYTGNMTFADNAKKEGYYKVDPNKEGFEIGDVVQYAQTKEDALGDRFNPKSLNPVNAKELVPQHAKIILDKYVDSDGITRYKVGHNGGSEDWRISTDPHDGRDLSETSLLEHFNKGFRTYDGIIVNRYDPDYVQKKEEDDKVETEAIEGKNQYASAYKNLPELDIKKETYDSYGKPIKTEYTEAKPLIDFYKKNYQKIGRSADMPPEILNKLFYNQIGIAAQETEFDNPLTIRAIGKALVPDWALTGARKVAGMMGEDATWVNDYWKKNADGVQGKYNNIDKFKKHLGEGSKLSPEGRAYLYYNSPKSKGMFQQKELSKRGRILNSNFDTPENQFVSSMYLAVDNYHLLKKKYPDLSNDELVDLTTLMHNAPSKALTPEFVNYYLKNNDIQYVNDIKSKRGVINQPDNLVKKIQKIQDEKSLNKISSQEKASIMDWAKNLSKKQYGGWLDSYEPGGEKPWGDMTAKERAAYLDAKEANAKAETTSRKQATKEHYQDYVKDSMKKTLEHPMFNTAQYFTPEGMAIGAIKGLANVGPDVAKGDYSAAAFDALTALPAVAPAVKNAYRINPWAKELPGSPNGLQNTYIHPTGKMEGIGDIKDIKRSLMREDQYLKPSEYNSKAIPFSSYKPQAGGYTDVPEFNQELNNMITTLQYGKRPLAKSVKTNPTTSKNALMESLDNSRYEEGMTNLIPNEYMKKAKIPYTGIKAFQTLHPNQYGGFYKKQGGSLDEYQDAGSTGVRPIQDNTRVVQTNFPKNLDELKVEQKKEINYQARKQAEQLMAINNAKNKEAQYQKDLKEGKVKKRISFMNYTPEEEVDIRGELARLRTIDNQRSTQEKLDDASLDVLTSVVPELPLLKYLKPAASLNKSSKLLKAAPENAFTYRGVVEPFKGSTKLVRDEADAYYNFLQERQNPYLAGQWKNEYKEFKKQYPVTSKSSTGIIEKPSDPEYYKNFLVNGKPIQEKPSWLLHEPQSNTLQIKSTMTGSPLEKQLSKTGEINVNNIKTHIGKAEVGQQDKFIIDKVLNEKFAGKTKIDYNDFRKAVSEELVPLEKSFDDAYSKYGVDKLGYNNKEKTILETSLNYDKKAVEQTNKTIKDLEKYENNPEGFLELYKETEYASTPINEVKRHIAETLEHERGRLNTLKNQVLEKESSFKNMPIENTSIVYGNKSKFGKGSIDHFADEGTLGHARILVSKEEPDVMHVLEQQSDFYQKKGQGKTILEKLKGDKTNNTLAREQELIGRAKSRLEENKKILKDLKYKKDNNLLHNGNNVHDSEISQLQGMVDGEQKAVSLREGNLKNWEQKEFLGKNHQERLLQENMLHAAEQGKSKMRYPTSETAAKIQGYVKLSKQRRVALEGELNEVPAEIHFNENGNMQDYYEGDDYLGIHKTILKKYDDTPKMIKKVLGKEAKVVTDPKGNTWYEFDIPDAAKKGKFEIKAFALGGGWLDEYQTGGDNENSVINMLSKNTLAKGERSNQDNTRVSNLPIKTLQALQAQAQAEKAAKQQYKQQPVISQGRKLNPSEQAYSDKVQARIANPSNDLGIIAANMASALTRFRYLNPEEIAATTNNPSATVGLSSNIMTEALANEMAGPAFGKALSSSSKAIKASKESGVLSNAYKLNPKALKENPEMFLYRAEPSNFNSQSTIDFMKQEVAAGKGKPWYKATIKSYEEGHPKLMAQNDFHGQWLEKDPARLDFYLNSGDKVDVGTPMSILRTKIPTSEATKYSVANNAKANVISASPNTEFVMPRNIIEQGEKFPESSWQKLIQEDKTFNTPHWLRGFPKELPGSPNVPKGNMYGENQVLTQQSRLLDPEIKAKFFEHQAPYIEPTITRDILLSRVMKLPKDYGNRITPENYEKFVKNIHGSTNYDLAANSWKKPENLGIGNYGKPGTVYSDAPLNNLGKDIVNAHEKNHGMFTGTLSKEMSGDLLKPFGTNKPIPFYQGKHQADEVLARMGQFKNAVGMSDNQPFTLDHLNLIRKNYAKSFLDNGITEMLAKIKPGSSGEKEFLKNMNKYAFGIGAPATVGAAALQQEKFGGWLDEEFRRGGQKGLKKYTSKNIQSSVNDIMLRNETLFGPAGKRRYKPNLKYKDGGWLDNMY